MLLSYLLLFMAQGSLALTCYNSTRVTESHQIEYKSHETSDQACADACTANDKCIAYLSNENGGRFECVQFGPAKEIMCTLPIFINMKVTCPTGVQSASLCIPYPSVLPAKMAVETCENNQLVVLNEIRLPKSITCAANSCTCPIGQYIAVSAVQAGCSSGLRLLWSGSGWSLYATLSDSAYESRRLPSGESLKVRCEMLSASLQQGNYTLPLVDNGFYGEKEIVCPKGLGLIGTITRYRIENASPEALHCNDGKGFVLDNERIVYATCKKF